MEEEAFMGIGFEDMVQTAEDISDQPDSDLLLGQQTKSWEESSSSSNQVLFVASTGIHKRKVKWCQCPNAPEHHIQLFRIHLFSATTSRPSTAFTFDVLDQFYIEAMECKTAAYNFFNKLRRLTSNAFPASVPVWCLFCLSGGSLSAYRTDTVN
jgi:hypothetical protein